MYDQVVVVGSGKFPVQCAVLFRRYCQDVALYEYKASTLSVSEKLCNKHGILYKNLDRISMGEELLKLEEKKVLVVSAFNTYLFTGSFLKKENITVINYHNAYLPNHPGRNAEAWCIYEGDSETGVTWHYVTEEIDAGKIIVQEKIEIGSDMTSLGLLKLQNERAYLLLEKIAGTLMRGEVKGITQQISLLRKIRRSNEIPNGGFLDVTWDVKMIYRFLRAMDYGVLNILGTPVLRLEDKTYVIIGYRLVRDGEVVENSTKETYMIDDGENRMILKLRECSE